MFEVGQKVLVNSRYWRHAAGDVTAVNDEGTRVKVKINTGMGGRTITWVDAAEVQSLEANGEC